MASKPKKRPRKSAARGPAPRRRTAPRRKRPARPKIHPLRRLWRWTKRLTISVLVFMFAWIAAYVIFDPPTTPYILAEQSRLGEIDREWVPLEEVSPFVARSIVAAEDANFCLHWGFDMAAIRAAIEDGAARGGSTVTQQVVKNAFLWQGRSWLRKALEALITPVVEAAWTKRRIVEIYLNIVEFDEGVFGVEAAARHYFGLGPEQLSARQAALLATVLPNPKNRSASQPSQSQLARARIIQNGAATILADGRSACFED